MDFTATDACFSGIAENRGRVIWIFALRAPTDERLIRQDVEIGASLNATVEGTATCPYVAI